MVGLDDGPDSAMSYIMGLGRHELLNLARVRQLLQSKWDAFGRRFLFHRLLRHLMLLALFQVASCFSPGRCPCPCPIPKAVRIRMNTCLCAGRVYASRMRRVRAAYSHAFTLMRIRLY